MNTDAFFQGMDPKMREEFLQKANLFLNTPKGQSVMRKIESDPALREKLRAAQAGGLSRLSKSDRDKILSALKDSSQGESNS